jgi:hypothetical protein
LGKVNTWLDASADVPFVVGALVLAPPQADRIINNVLRSNKVAGNLFECNE